jgi:hypothetical protein
LFGIHPVVAEADFIEAGDEGRKTAIGKAEI